MRGKEKSRKCSVTKMQPMVAGSSCIVTVLTIGKVKDWVVEQTRERIKRQLESEERDYQDKLLAARKREELMRRKAHARVLKKAVRSIYLSCLHVVIMPFSEMGRRQFERIWIPKQRCHRGGR